MSGGGGPGHIDPGIPCDDLKFDTTLASPIEGVVEELEIGDDLEIQLQRSEGSTYLHIAVIHGEDIAGTIVEKVPEMVRCLQEGVVDYQARVTNVQGDIYRIHVSPK